MKSAGALTASTACTVPSRGQMEDREGAGGRIATDGDFLHIERQPGDLQPHVVLIGPEPRHFRRRRRTAAQIGRRLLRLFQRVRHALQSAGSPIQRQRTARAIADRVDRGIRRSRVRIDDDAVVAGQAGGTRQRIVRRGANAHQHRIACHGGSVVSRTDDTRPASPSNASTAAFSTMRTPAAHGAGERIPTGPWTRRAQARVPPARSRRRPLRAGALRLRPRVRYNRRR